MLKWLKEVSQWLDDAWKPVEPNNLYRSEGFGHGPITKDAAIDYSKRQCEENAGEACEWKTYGDDQEIG